MDVDAKDIQILMWRVLKFFMNVCSGFAQKHPVFSGVLFFLFVLYTFLPSFFYLLIYASPFLVCAAVYTFSKCPQIRNAAMKDREISSEESESWAAGHLVVNGSDHSAAQKRNVLQKIVNEKSKGFDEETTENRMVLPANPGQHVIGGASCNVSMGENIAELSSNPIEAAKFQGGGETEVECSTSEEDDHDEEEVRESGNKAVEWNEDDQKNLMDLGISEMERNRRLESLIARRRSRKLFKTYTEKNPTVMDAAAQGSVAPVLVARSSALDVTDCSDERMPGSAPSILLPTRNPFDLPYDPLEEKPNLMADSFHQEFMAAHQKEMLFYRHENFSTGPSFPFKGMQDQSKRQSDKGNNNLQVEHLISQGSGGLRRTLSVTDLVTEEGHASDQKSNKPEEDRESGRCRNETKVEKMENANDGESSWQNGSAIKMKTHTNAILHQQNKSSSSYSSEDEQILSSCRNGVIKQRLNPPVFRSPEVVKNPMADFVPCRIPRGRSVNELLHYSSPSTAGHVRIEDHLFHTDGGLWHTPSNSIASDMQVEVSEVGSPPLTVDGSGSSSDGDSLTYDGDVEKENNSGSDEMWGVSPHASAVELRDFNGGFLDVKREHEGSSVEWPRLSSSPSRSETAQDCLDRSISFEHKISNDLEQDILKVRDLRSSNALSAEASLQEAGLMQSSMNHTRQSEKLVNPPEELNVIHNEEDPTHKFGEVEELKSIEDRDDQDEKSTKQEGLGDLSKPLEESGPESTKYTESTPHSSAEEVHITYNMDDPTVNIEDHVEDMRSLEDRGSGSEKSSKEKATVEPSKPAEVSDSESSKLDNHFDSHGVNQVMLQSVLPSGKNEDLKSIEVIDSEIVSTHGDNESISKSFKGNGNMISTANSIEHRYGSEVGVSGVDESSDDPSTSATQRQLVSEPVSAHSSSTSSPKSVLTNVIPTEQISSSNLNQPMHRDPETAERNKSSEEQCPEDSVLSTTQNAHQVIHHSTFQPSEESNYGKFEKPSNTQGSSSNEAKENYGLNEPVFDNEEVKRDLNFIDIVRGASATLIGLEATMELSNLPEENNSRQVEHIKVISSNASEYAASVDQSKVDSKGLATSKIPEVWAKEEESVNSPATFAEEADITGAASNSSANQNMDVEETFVEENEGEPQFSIRQNAIPEPLRPADTISVRDLQGTSQELAGNETIPKPTKSLEATDTSLSGKDVENIGHVDQKREVVDLIKPEDDDVASEATEEVQSVSYSEKKDAFNASVPPVDNNHLEIPSMFKGEELPDSLTQNSNIKSDIIHNSNEKFKLGGDSGGEF